MRLLSPRLLFSVFFCLTGLFACSGSEQQALVDKLRVDEPFPNILLQPLDGGEPVAFEAFKGRLVVLNIWATWCEPCRREMPNLQALSDGLDPQRFVVLGLAQEDDQHLVREYLLDTQVSFVSFIDPEGQIATEQLGVPILPYTLIIAPSGGFVQRISGPREWDHPDVVELLEQAYKGDYSGLRED